MRRPIVAVGLVVLVCLAGSASADVPPWISYQGVLMDSGGNPVPDGTYDVTFRVYDEAAGVAPALWEETQSLLVTDAIMNAHLGSVTPLNVLDFEDPYWLGISVDGDPEMTPRTAFTTVPYAVHSVYADEGGNDGDWVIDGDNVYREPGRVGMGTNTPGAKLHVLTGDEIAGDFTNGSQGVNATIRAKNVGGTAGAFFSQTGYLADTPTAAVMGIGGVAAKGGYFRSDESEDALVGEVFGEGSAVVGNSFGDGYAGYFTGGPGVRIEGQAHVDGFRMDSGAVDGYVLTTDGTGFATWAPTSSGVGGNGTTNWIPMFTAPTTLGDSPLSVNSLAVDVNDRAFIVTRNSYTTPALHVKQIGSPVSGSVATIERTTNVPYDYALLRLQMPSASESDAQFLACRKGTDTRFQITREGDVFGKGWVYLTDGLRVRDTNSTTALRVEATLLDLDTAVIDAEFTGSGSVDVVAVRGTSEPADYYGIGGRFRGGYRGVEGRVTPTGSGTYTGVYGIASGGTGVNRGVYGYAGGGAANYAGYFSGNVAVSGTLSKGAGSFKIDHPLDPTGKYLLHSFVESPDMKNVYDGVAVLDASGEARVELPEWFESLNRDFRYQLTCIGAFAPVYVSEEISGNRFAIAGGEPGMKVSWQVTGIRHDAFAEANRIPVEEEKSPKEIGKYLHPEAFGLPETESIEYEERQKMRERSEN